MQKLIAYPKKTFTQLAYELGNLSEELIQSIPNEVLQQLVSFQNDDLEKTIYDFIQSINEFSIELIDTLDDLNQNLEAFILKGCEEDLSFNNQIISFIKHVFDSKINEEQFNYTIQNWHGRSLSAEQIKQISEGFKLQSLIQMIQIKNIIAQTTHNQIGLKQFSFFDKLLENIIKQEKDSIGREDQVFESLEYIAINLINNKVNNQALEQVFHYQHYQLQSILKHKQIKEFLVARHFDKWLSKISEDFSKSDRTIFAAMRNQSKIKNINYIDDKFSGSLDYLKESYASYEFKKQD